MRKKYYYLFIVIIAFNLIFYPFFGVEAKETKEQRDVCSGPSKTMGLYFQFQNEMMSAMLWSEVSEKRFYSTKSDGGLFKEKYLTLGTGSINALDILATSIRWNMQAAWSTITTLTVLLELAGLSVLQSNTEWLRILTKDRVIVREYKSLLDIETSLMELAYYLSQHVSLITSFDWNLLNNVKSVIEKYQELWLLEKKANLDRLNWVTIADIMGELVLMNGYMKHFVLFNAWLGDFKPSLIPGFDSSDWGAIEQLKKDYGWLWLFWACNQYASNINSTRNKWIKNSKDSLKNSMNDVKLATKRLATAFSFSNWGESPQDSNRCDMSEYEMAQLRAYRWWNRTCKTWIINGNVATTIQKFAWEKKAQEKQKEKTTNLSKEQRKALKEQAKQAEKQAKEEAKQKKEQEKQAKKEAKQEKKETKNQLKDTFKAVTTGNLDQKKEIWRELFWSGATFNVLWYSAWFNSWLVDIYLDINSNYRQSQQNAISSDLSYELVNIKALLDQVDDTSSKMEELKKTLKEIAKYQCEK